MTAFVAPPQQSGYDANMSSHLFHNDAESAASAAAAAATDASSYDDLSFDAVWSPMHNSTPRNHLQQQQMFDLEAVPQGFIDVTSAAAAMSAASSAGTASPATYTAMASAAYPVSVPSSNGPSLPFDPTFGLTMPDGSMPDFGHVDGTDDNSNNSSLAGDRLSAFVDPSLLQPTSATSSHTPLAFSVQHAPSTSPSSTSSSALSDSRRSLKHANDVDSSSAQPPLKKSRSNSPYLQTSSHGSWQQAYSSSHSLHGPASDGSSSDAEGKDKEKGRCPFPECGKIFKDLKAHILTHSTERPEKCPIPSCEYNKKGFSRKYDKNRHTLTHYKGTMICGFCPGSGSSAEKSFNRADVFKRHLTTVHHVEQSPPNSRKKQSSSSKKEKGLAPGTTGKCSICSQIFQTPQDFYEHLEDCVLDVVQKVDPGEAINEAILASMADDKDTNATIKRHAIEEESLADADGESDDEAAEEHDFASKQAKDMPAGSALQLADGKTSSRGPGVTYSAAGIPFHRQPRKRRKNYPNSWGCSADKMKMKKRVLAVFDGHNRLIKDDLMISSDFEVRMKLNLPSQPGQPGAGVAGDSGAYVTDLDVETLRRADGFFQASEAERGPWRYTNVPGIEAPQNFNVNADGSMAAPASS